MNNVTLIGRLTRDPKEFKNCTKFTIAIDRNEDVTDFPEVTCFGKTAEAVNKCLTKGRQVAVDGYIQTGSYEGENGTVYTTDIVARRVEFLGSSETREETKPKSKKYR